MFVPVMMTSSSTSSAGKYRSLLVLASAEATLTFSENAAAWPRGSTNVATLVVIAELFFITGFLCNLLFIACSKESVGQINLGGEQGTWPVNQT